MEKGRPVTRPKLPKAPQASGCGGGGVHGVRKGAGFSTSFRETDWLKSHFEVKPDDCLFLKFNCHHSPFLNTEILLTWSHFSLYSSLAPGFSDSRRFTICTPVPEHKFSKGGIYAYFVH